MNSNNYTDAKIPVVIYARYSSSGQRDESIEGQLRECHEFCKKSKYQVIGEYVDRALTGTSDKRPDFQRMIKDSDKHLFKHVIVWKLDRFSRNKYDTAIYKNKLKKNNVTVISAKEAIPDGPEGTILESIMEGFAQYYSENLSQNVRRGIYENALGRKVLGSNAGLGYKKSPEGKYAIDEETAPTVRRIFEEFASGKSAKDIYTKLNAEGYKTTKGARFNKNSLTYILKNEKYIGVYRHEDIYDPEGIPPIVSRELFEKCQALLERHHHAPAASREVTFLLTGKVYCGECHNLLTGDSGTSHNGSVYYYYTCNGRRRHSCELPRIKKDILERKVFETLNRIIGDDTFIEYVADRAVEYQGNQDLNAAVKAIEKNLRDNEKAINNVMSAIEQGIVTSTTKNRLLELERQRDILNIELSKESIKTPELTKDQIVYFLRHFRDGAINDELFQMHIVDMFLKAVYVYHDGTGKVLINYTENEEKIDISEVKEASASSSLESTGALLQWSNLGHFYFSANRIPSSPMDSIHAREVTSTPSASMRFRPAW